MKSIEDVLRNYFIPAIIGESLNCYNLLQVLIALPTRLEVTAVTRPHLNTEAKYNASWLPTGDIADHFVSQNTEYKPNKEIIFVIKNNIKKGRTETENTNLSRIR